MKFNKDQKEILENSDIDYLSEEIIFQIASGETSLQDLDSKIILNFLETTNALYRAGFPIIENNQYDTFREYFSKTNPDHPFVTTVEPEPAPEAKTIPLPEKMLSTEKAYTKKEIERWVQRIKKAAAELGIDEKDIVIRVTPKLDGYAAFDDGAILYTRGDGSKGQDISRVFGRGLKIAENGERGQGPGEIVINRQYFEEKLSDKFENSRNIQAAIIAEKNVDPVVQKAILDGAAVFFPFSLLHHQEVDIEYLLSDFDSIIETFLRFDKYDIDGVIIETTNQTIKDFMGATRHHHRWQIAFKVNDEKAEVKVIKVIPQTSRTGRLTPVVELEPTRLSGALISRATAHHYGMVKTKGIGPGAIIELVRSGLVIPKIEKVIKEAEPEIPEKCPSCGSHAEWDGDNIYCLNTTECVAQTENTLIHFFKTLGNIDGFGPATVAILHSNGIKTIHEVYQLDGNKLLAMGFKEKSTANLLSQLEASRRISIEDWRFLSAFGVVRLGQGTAERLLQHHGINSIFELNPEDLIVIDGFAEKTSETIVEGLKNIRKEFLSIYELGFNLERTSLASEATTFSPIAGKTIVFTGSMKKGTRSDMEKEAKSLGATVGKSITSKTSLLVIGENVGTKKIADAKKHSTNVISELEYLDLIHF